MRTKATAAACTILVYCLVLVGFPRNSELSQSANAADFSAGPVSTGLVAFSRGIGSSVKRLQPAPKAARRKPAAPACDPLLYATIREFNKDLSKEGAEKLAKLIETTSKKYRVDKYLVTALVSQESRFYQNAVSRVGALGLGQLMPGTARELGVNPHSSRENLDGCVRYLAQHLNSWSHTRDPVALALASYNAGAGNVRRYGGVPPFEETRNYVRIIKKRYALLSRGKQLRGV